MVGGTGVVRPTRSFVVATAATIGALALFGVAYADNGASATSGTEFVSKKRSAVCPDGKACAWTGAYYDGSKTEYSGASCCDWLYSGIRGSAKNRMNNRPFRMSDGYNERCLNPGQNQDFFNFHYVKVGGQGNRC